MPEAASQSVDPRLMNSPMVPPGGESAVADQNRQEKRGGEVPAEQEGAEKQGKSLRELTTAARKAIDIKAKAKEAVEKKIFTPLQMATAWLLRIAMLDVLFTLGTASYGLSIIYVNVHMIGLGIFGDKLFCPLGYEWVPKSVKTAGGEKLKSLSSKLKIGDICIIAIADMIWLLVFFLGVTFLVLVADVYMHPIRTAVGVVWGAIRSVFQI